MPATRPIPSAKVIVWGLGLMLVGVPVLRWLFDHLDGDPGTQGLATFCDLLATVLWWTAIGLLLRGAWAVFTSYDAVAVRFLAGGGTSPAPGTEAPTTAAPDPSAPGTPSSDQPAIRIPTSSEALAGPTAAPRARPALADADLPHRPVMPPLPGRPTTPPPDPSTVRIVATPPPDDDA